MIPLRSTPIHHLRTGELRYSRPPPTRAVAPALGRLDVNLSRLLFLLLATCLGSGHPSSRWRAVRPATSPKSILLYLMIHDRKIFQESVRRLSGMEITPDEHPTPPSVRDFFPHPGRLDCTSRQHICHLFIISSGCARYRSPWLLLSHAIIMMLST